MFPEGAVAQVARTPDPDEAPIEIPGTQSERAVTPPWALAITGASGAPYAVRLLEVLAAKRVPLWLIVSSHGWRLLSTEAGISTQEQLIEATGGDWSAITTYDDNDRGAVPASGSAPCSGMVICPCSMGTVAAVAHGTSRSLVERAADVTLKERRPLLLIPRETPLSLLHLRHLSAVTEGGATVIPAAPGFYHRPTHVSQLVDFIVQRILDHMKLDIQLVAPWEGGE
jgi:4-hydroxy-3-polyprenylbenzoate decarboxylase